MVFPAEPKPPVPAGLLERLVIDLTTVRPSEVARVRRAIEAMSLDDRAVLDAIAGSLLDVANW